MSVLKMIQICDSLFPIGAFTLSNGLETMVAVNRISSSKDLEEYVNSFLQILPYNDLGVMMLAYKHFDDMDYILELDNISMCGKAPMEVRNGSRRLCNRFLKIWDDIHDINSLKQYAHLIECDESVIGNHAIAVGLYAKESEICLDMAAQIYAYSLITSIVTNAVKTVPLSQRDGQRILYDVQDKIKKACECAGSVSLEDIGIGGAEFDIAAMNHEIMYSRLYMS